MSVPTYQDPLLWQTCQCAHAAVAAYLKAVVKPTTPAPITLIRGLPSCNVVPAEPRAAKLRLSSSSSTGELDTGESRQPVVAVHLAPAARGLCRGVCCAATELCTGVCRRLQRVVARSLSRAVPGWALPLVAVSIAVNLHQTMSCAKGTEAHQARVHANGY